MVGKCTWDSSPIPPSLDVLKVCPGDGVCLTSEGPYLVNSSKIQQMPTDALMILDTCKAPGVSYNGENGTWHIMHIGPFESRGGIETFTAEGWPLAAAWEVGWAITEWAVSVRSTPEGERLKMPDFHVHHLSQYTHPPKDGGKIWEGNQWWREAGAGDASSGLYINAADLECNFMSSSKAGGCGQDFFYNALPEGYAYFVLPEHQTSEGVLTAFIQDQRPVGSPPRQWHIEIAALRVDPGHRRAAYKMTFGQDRSETYSQFQTQKIPTGRESLNWFQAVWPSDGEILFEKVHTHIFAADMWVVAGRLEDCGLGNATETVNSPASHMYAPDAIPLPMRVPSGEVLSTLEDARSYISQNIARSGKQVVCKYTFKNVTDAVGRTAMVINVADKMRCDSLRYPFKKGEPLTFVASSYAPPVDLYPEGIQAHFIWSSFVHLTEFDDFAKKELQRHRKESAEGNESNHGPGLQPPQLQAHVGASSSAPRSLS